MTDLFSRLGEHLLESNLISSTQLDQALELSRSDSLLLGESLVRLGLLSESSCLELISGITGAPLVREEPARSDLNDILSFIPREYSEATWSTPFALREDTVSIAALIPWDTRMQERIEAFTGLRTDQFIATREWISEQIGLNWDERANPPEHEKTVAELNCSTPDRCLQDENSVEAMEREIGEMEKGVLDLARPATSRASSELNRLINECIFLKASDLHIESLDKGFLTRMRVDGVLMDSGTDASRTLQKALVTRIKVLGGMDISETRMPQDGRFTIRTKNRETYDARVSTMPSAHGERVVMRLLPGQLEILGIESLGFPEQELKTLRGLLSLPHGILLVTGPTGSGKTTTLYGALDSMDRVSRNIITLEDPIETRLKGISQIQVNHEIGFTFAAGLRSVLRQDPDVIMVGEIRDSETASIAVHASLTGHMVLSTLHTRDAVGALLRMASMGTDPMALTSSLNGVVAQRLVRRLCSCSIIHSEVSDQELSGLSAEAKLQLKDREIRVPQGCPLCRGTGYLGRTAIVEVLPLNNKMRELIRSGATESELRSQAAEIMTQSMEIAGIQKVLTGETSLSEVTRVTAGV